MIFEDEMKRLEKQSSSETFTFSKGNIPALLIAIHTVNDLKEDGLLKLGEPYTKAIALYVANKVNAYTFIKNKANKIDVNNENLDEIKKEIINFIKENDIKIVIDLHGADKNRDFDVEFGTLNNLSMDYSALKELEDAFVEQGITKIKYNDPFKGGGVTKNIFANTNIDVIQIEINKKYRDINTPKEMEKICKALINYLNQHSMYTVL